MNSHRFVLADPCSASLRSIQAVHVYSLCLCRLSWLVSLAYALWCFYRNPFPLLNQESIFILALRWVSTWRGGLLTRCLLELGSWFGPSSLQLITGSGLPLLAPGPFVQTVLKHISVLLCSWLLFCVSLGSLILRPQSASHKRSRFLSCGFPFSSSAPVTLTAGRCGCSAEHPIYSPGWYVSSVHLQVSSSRGHEPLLGCPCGKDSLLSLALRSQHSSVACIALILASNRLHGERCSLCFTLFIL